MVDLNKDVKFVKGAGPNRVKLLNQLGIFTLSDLIEYFPRGHEDRSKVKEIASLVDGETALFEAVVVNRMSEIKIRKGLTLCKLILRDETGTCTATWFNQPYLKQRFKTGECYKFYGKVNNKYGKIDIQNPVFDEITAEKNTGKIIPIYPLTYGLSQNIIRKIIEEGMAEVNGRLEETLPQYLIDTYNLCDINNAISGIHFPSSFEKFEFARKRLVFEELLIMQLALLNLKNKYSKNEKGIAFNKAVKMSDVIDTLEFRLTKAQLKVLEEIDNDMEKDIPMNRLLQGDVGSGKTIVAMIAMYKAVKSGYQATIMAPTAILAKQHEISFKEIFNKFNIRCELITSSITKKKKEAILSELQDGKIDILIGTHAILEENVIFKNLGLVVTDEQHRFGVRQRSVLVQKGVNPDVLVMTATPIPRTLGLILYGDLDISTIDELPPNRKTIKTYAVTHDKDERLNNFVIKNVQEGRQAYIVCPLVEESEEINAASVLELTNKYKNEVFKELKVEYIHGKMKAKEKEQIMEDFNLGKIDVLISTTVIEVGVNVPNANIMIIESAQRFGLAELHQLRGRVGRGEHQSYCILKYESDTQIVKERMNVMTSTNDGFIIAEKDLELRGTGEFFGTKQHGIPEFKIANLFHDMETLKQVQSVAFKILDKDKNLETEENQLLKEQVDKKFIKKVEL